MDHKKSVNEIDRKNRMRGTVIRNDDPLLEGRIGVLIPKLLLKADPNIKEKVEEDIILSKDDIKNKSISSYLNNSVKSVNYIWARPVFHNEYLVPYIGQTVYCFLEDGDPNKVYYQVEQPTLEGEVTTMEKVKNTKNKTDPNTKPLIKVIKEFKDGTIIYYDENDTSKRFAITYNNNMSISINYNEKEKNIELITTDKNLVVLDDLNKNIFIKTTNDNIIKLDDANKNILIKTTGGHIGKFDDSGKNITLKSTGGNSVIINDSGNTITTKSAGGGTAIVNPTGCELKSVGIGIIRVTPSGVSVN